MYGDDATFLEWDDEDVSLGSPNRPGTGKRILDMFFINVLFVFETMKPQHIYAEKPASFIQNPSRSFIHYQTLNLGGGFKYFFVFTPIWGRFPF